MANVLLIAEHNNSSINEATLRTVTASEKLGGIDVLIAGYKCKNLSNEAAKIAGIDKIIFTDNITYQHQLPENTATLISLIGKNYDYIIAPSTSTSRNILPRVAGLLDTQMISDVTEVINANTFTRLNYAGNILTTLESNDKIKILSVRTSAFEPANIGTEIAPIEEFTPANNSLEDSQLSSLIKKETIKSDRPELTSARIVIGCGRSLQNTDDFQMIEQMADKLGAAIGATRSAVNAGFVSDDCMIGQSGKIISPDLYIAIGISGAVQHLSGIKDSKIIVAINHDSEAPIFQIADYGLVEEISTALPKLIEKLT